MQCATGAVCAECSAARPALVLQLYRQIQGSGDVAQNAYDLDLDEDDVQQARPRCARCVHCCALPKPCDQAHGRCSARWRGSADRACPLSRVPSWLPDHLPLRERLASLRQHPACLPLPCAHAVDRGHCAGRVCSARRAAAAVRAADAGCCGAADARHPAGEAPVEGWPAEQGMWLSTACIAQTWTHRGQSLAKLHKVPSHAALRPAPTGAHACCIICRQQPAAAARRPARPPQAGAAGGAAAVPTRSCRWCCH